MRRIMKLGRPSHATVVAYLALFLALGGSAYAFHLGKNSVGSKQLKKNAVTAKKIKKNAVTAAKIKADAVTSTKVGDGSLTGNDLADGTITGAKVANGSLTGGDIDQSSLNAVRASNVISIAMNGNCTPATPFPAGVSAEVNGDACRVTFGSNVYNCAATASVALRTSLLVIAAERTVFTLRKPNTPNQILTIPYTNGATGPEPVDLTLVC